MKRYLILTLCAGIAAFAVSCAKSGPASEAKKLADATVSITQSTAEKLDKASNAKDAADALVSYATEMKTIADKSKEFRAKYPNFDDKNDPTMKDEQEKIQKTIASFSAAMSKAMMKYAGSKEMMDAITKMSELTR
jgi:hypothetical protein